MIEGKKILRIVYFTENGAKTAKRLEDKSDAFLCEYKDSDTNLKDFISDSFRLRLPILFVGSVGIAVRMVAEFVENKLSDSAVIVTDELGLNVIPILSGHFGGANELAKTISGYLNSNPVITTATDINNVFAVDVFAREKGFRIEDKSMIKKVSAKALRGEELSFIEKDDCLYVEELKLIPKNMVLGIGCKKGKSFEELLAFVLSYYSKDELINNLYAICSIDVKCEEKGLIKLAAYLGTKFLCFSANELKELEGDFKDSEFVKDTVGVGNVCERAAILGAGKNAVIVKNKTAYNGMTLAEAARQ